MGVLTPLMLIPPVPRLRRPTPPLPNCAPVYVACAVIGARAVSNTASCAVGASLVPHQGWRGGSEVDSVCARAVALTSISAIPQAHAHFRNKLSVFGELTRPPEQKIDLGQTWF